MEKYVLQDENTAIVGYEIQTYNVQLSYDEIYL